MAGLVTRMAGDSPGLGLLLVAVVMGSLVRGNSEVVGRTVVVEIQELTQPYNCSAFFDHMEVSSFCPFSFVTRKSVGVKAEFGYLTMGCSCALGRVCGTRCRTDISWERRQMDHNLRIPCPVKYQVLQVVK